MQRHGEMCRSEQYIRCALAACHVLVLVGYTDPSRPFHVNEETILCSGKGMDAASGSAAPVLRYFCSQAHCEEGKEDHEVTMKEYNCELARKESELDRKAEELAADQDNLVKKIVDSVQKLGEVAEDLKRERQNHELKLRELETDVYKSKRSLKEMGEVVKRETANLERIFRKKELENEREVTSLRLLQSRKEECLFVRHVGLLEEFEVFYREKYAGDELALQEQLTRTRESAEQAQKGLMKARKDICGYEEQQLSKSKELDAINAVLGSNDKGSSTTTTPVTATTPATDLAPVKSPAEHSPTTDTSMSTSVRDNPTAAPPSSSATPSPEGQKVTSRKEKMRNERNSQMEMMRELRRKRERELELQKDKICADLIHLKKRDAELQQKIAELKEGLKRVRQNHELKQRAFETDMYKSQISLKEMGEVTKLGTASLGRIFRMKELENELEVARLRLLQLRAGECLFLRHVGLLEEYEVFYREKYAGDEIALQESLLRLLEDQEKAHKALLEARERIRDYEDRRLLASKELNAINAELGINDKATSIATTNAAAAASRLMKMSTPADHVLTSTSLSTSVTNNPPSAPSLSSAIPPSERQKDKPRKEKKKSRRDEKNSQLEMERELRQKKQIELDLKKKKISASGDLLTLKNIYCQRKRDDLEEDLKRERQNHELKLRELEKDVYKSKIPLKEMGAVLKRETANLERIFRKKEIEHELERTRINLLEDRGIENLIEGSIRLDEEYEVFYRKKYAGDEALLRRRLRELEWGDHQELFQKSLLKARNNIRNMEHNLRLINEDLDAINAELSSNDTATATALTSAANPGPVKTPAESALLTSGKDNPPAAPPSFSVTPPPDGQKVLSGEQGQQDEEKEVEEKLKREAEERKTAFEELVREKEADLTKRKDVIESLAHRKAEELQKIRGVGACERDRNATDPTDAELIAMGPVAVTYNKYRKLDLSLTRDHDVKKCELDIEIAKFSAKALRTERSLLMLKVDQLEEPTEGCDAEDQRHYDDQLLVYQAELTRMNEEIDECNGRCELLEQRLLELVAVGEGVR